MISLTIKEIADIVGGTSVNIDEKKIITESPEIDSRKVTADNYFIALPGERVDGTDFAKEAIRAGASFVLMTTDLGIPAIIVKDSLMALQQLAKEVRARMNDCTFIGITGSHGKTTTKDLLGHILPIAGKSVVPRGSFNNEIGVPLTILQCTDETKYCVLEMGARHIGDITALTKIGAPQIGVVLVVGSAHVGEFGNSQGIAQAKGELIASLQSDGVAILGTYDSYSPKMQSKPGVKRVLFGENPECNVRAADIEFREGRAHFDLVAASGRAPVALRLLGMHQISNALAAAAVALEVGISIESVAAALSTAEISSKWRMELHDLHELLFINDSYNANPESVSAALRTLVLLTQERGGSSWAFLGKMHELGESEAEEHLTIGRLASELGVDHLVSVGTDLYLNGLELSHLAGDEMSTHYALTQEEAVRFLRHIEEGDVLLIKASRAEHLDELSEKLIAGWQVKYE
jgi:UDP-N-acetylmuramoyl-tripeptide--D-alanyl-D-alanine ligase